MPDDFLRLCVRWGRWTKRSRRRGVGQEGMPRIVAQRGGLSIGFRVVSEQRIKMVVEALLSVIHSKSVDWAQSWGPRPMEGNPVRHQDTLSDSSSPSGGGVA